MDCPQCGQRLRIAKSFSKPEGQIRIHYCCGEEITTVEAIIPTVGQDYLIVTGVKASDGVRRIRETAESYGGTILNRKRYG